MAMRRHSIENTSFCTRNRIQLWLIVNVLQSKPNPHFTRVRHWWLCDFPRSIQLSILYNCFISLILFISRLLILFCNRVQHQFTWQQNIAPFTPKLLCYCLGYVHKFMAGKNLAFETVFKQKTKTATDRESNCINKTSQMLTPAPSADNTMIFFCVDIQNFPVAKWFKIV